MNGTWWLREKQLDPRQRAFIDDLPLDISHLITGPPGSGKTNLLLLRASQLVNSGKPNVLIIVFTRTLREFFASGSHHYAFDNDNIQTLAKWSYDFLRENGVRPENNSNIIWQRKMRLVQLQEIATKNRLSGLYDAIILDEAQDYFPEEIDLFIKLGKVVFAAADSRQHIYSDDALDPSKLKDHFVNVYPLQYHYRNCRKVCLIADKLAEGWGEFEPLKDTCKYDENLYPSFVPPPYHCADIEAQVSEMCINVERQLKAYPDDYIGVICPTRRGLEKIWSLVKNSKMNHSLG